MNNIVHIQTEDINYFKILIEILDGLVPEAEAEFIRDINLYDKKFDDRVMDGKIEKTDKKKKKKKNDESSFEEENIENNPGQIKIVTIDTNQVMITSVRLYGSAFKKFLVLPESYKVGLNLDELYKYIKNVDKDGVLDIYIHENDLQKIIFKVAHNSAPRVSICELRIMNLISRPERKIEANIAIAIRLPCGEFHRACKDLMQFSQYVEITCDKSKFIITCKGEMSAHSRIFHADGKENGINIKTVNTVKPDEPLIIRLIFDLKYINTMYKCSGLCDDMEIYLNTDSVMFLKYGIKLMGEMLVGISPKISEKSSEQYNDEQAAQDEEEEIQFFE